MMGVLFMAAGSSTDNREKTLERSYSVEELRPYLKAEEIAQLEQHFPSGDGVFAWGASKKNYPDVKSMNDGEFVVDIKNREAVQVFRFCFWVDKPDDKIQRYFSWDESKRPYRRVYFLRDPRRTRRDALFFRNAFSRGVHWLPGQEYFDDSTIEAAMKKTASATVEEFLGITEGRPSRPAAHSTVLESEVKSPASEPDEVASSEVLPEPTNESLVQSILAMRTELAQVTQQLDSLRHEMRRRLTMLSTWLLLLAIAVMVLVIAMAL